MRSSSWTLDLATAVATHGRGEFPAPVVEHGGLVLADTVAAIVAGAREPEMTRLAARRSTADGVATMLGTGLKARLEDAALVNSIAGTAVEMDEGNYASGGHPAIHAVPAALAVAEARAMSGADLLDAVIVGYEVGARIGRATRLHASVHAHGTWGTVAAAAATARLRRLDAGTAQQALLLAAGLATATSRSSALAGAGVRNVYAGIAARNGLLACDLAEDGFTGEADAPEIAFGRVIGSEFAPERATAGWGEGWEIARNFIKFAACCKETQGALEALADLLRRDEQNRIRAADIAAIEVVTFADAAALAECEPATPLAARFSIPFVVATRIVRGKAGVADFQAAALADGAIRALARKVVVREDPELSARVPAERITRMTISFASGSSVATEVAGSLGDFDRPYDRSLLAYKFVDLVGGAPADAYAWHERWRRIGDEPSIGGLINFCG